MKTISIAVKMGMMVFIFSLTAAAYADTLEVIPSDYDFGEVEVGTSSTAIISLSNINGSNVTIYGIEFQAGSSGDFTHVNTPPVPFDIAPSETFELEVGFCPSSEGYVAAILEIDSSDTSNPTQEVL
jgi:hypothetical protein